MPEMRCAGCMQAGIVVFMDSVLCGECFFRQTVVARAVRGRFEAAIGGPPVAVAPVQATVAGDLLSSVITRLQWDLKELLSVLTTPDSGVMATRHAALAPAEKRGRSRRRAPEVSCDAASPRGSERRSPSRRSASIAGVSTPS